MAGTQPNGEAVPHLIELVERGLIRILDLAFIAKDEDGSVARSRSPTSATRSRSSPIFEGASSGLLADEDLERGRQRPRAGTAAALLVYENSWAAPFATAVRSSGGQLVAGGRIPVQAVIDALDAAEAA